MTQRTGEPPVLFRDVERERILNLVLATFGPDGAPRPGARVHLAVTAPRQGGLTVFLADLFRAAARDPRLFPVRVVVEDPKTWEHELARAVEAIRAESGGAGPGDSLLPSSAVVAAARELWNRARRVTLLVLDLGTGLRQLTAVADDLAAANPLVEFLRAVVNLAEDGEAPLAIVGGWGDDVRLALQRWRRDDVAQRFFPVIPLWANFGCESSVEVWGRYREILSSHGIETTGDYPGFVRGRDPVPVGEVLDRVRRAERKQVDGLFLVDLLRQRHPNPDPAVRDLDSAALAALCLEDRVVTDGPLLPLLEGRFGSWVEPGDGGLRATAELYAQLGLLPPRTVVGLREQVLFRLGQGNDPELAAEILTGVSTFLAAPQRASPAVTGGFATGAFRVASRLPAWTSEIRMEGFAYLGQANEPVLAQEVASAVRRAEEDPNGRAGHLVLVLLRPNGPRVALLRGVNEALAAGGPVSVIKSGLANDPARPVVLSILEVTDEQAIDAVGRARGELRPAEHLPALRDGLADHFKEAERVLPPILPAAFAAGVLNVLQQRSHLALDRQAVHDALPRRTPPTDLQTVTRAFEALERLRAIEKAGRSRYRWTFPTDAFLAELREGLPESADQLFARTARGHLIDRATWIGLYRDLLGAYRDFLTENTAPVAARDPRPRLTERLARWCESLGGLIQTLHDRGETARAAELRAALARVETQLNDSGADLSAQGEQLAALAVDTEQALTEAESAVAGIRERVLTRLDEIGGGEVPEDRKSEAQLLRDRAAAGNRVELETLEQEVEAFAAQVERDEALAKSNRKAEGDLRLQLAKLRQRLAEASDRLADADHPRATELTGAVRQARGALEELQTEIDQSCTVGATERAGQLTRLLGRITELKASAPSTEEITVATRAKSPSPRPTGAPRPRRPATAPPPEPTGGAPPPPPPVIQPDPRPPAGPRVPTAEVPPLTSVGVPPAGGDPDPTTLLRPSPAENAETPAPPVVGTTPEPAQRAPTEPHRAEQSRVFTDSEPDLTELLALLNSSAHILAVEVESDAADS